MLGLGGCCGCSSSLGASIVATERIGDGWIVAVADSNIYFSDPDSEEPCDIDNSLFWSNVRSLLGSGDIGCPGDETLWKQSEFLPTVGDVDSAGELTGLAAMIEGFRIDPIPILVNEYAISNIAAADYLPWLEAGGVLVLVSDYYCNPGLNVSESTAIVVAYFNTLLEGLGATIRFHSGCLDCECDGAPESVRDQIEGEGWPACRNSDHPLIDGTHGAPLPYIGYACTSWLTGGDWVAKRADPACLAKCDPGAIDDGDLGVITLEGLAGSVAYKACLSRTDDPDEGRYWGGDTGDSWEHPDCPGTDLAFRLRCKQTGSDPDVFAWTLEVTVGTTTVDLPVDITDGSPLSGTVSGTLTGICGGVSLTGTLSACGEPVEYPCCNGDLDPAERCCLEIPSLYVWHEYTYEVPTSGGPVLETVEVSGTFVWDAADNRWEGTLDWTTDGAGCGSPGSTSWTDAVITCGYTLASATAGVSYGSSTYPCPITAGGFEVPDVVNPTKCIATQTKTLKFFPSPLLSPEP